MKTALLLLAALAAGAGSAVTVKSTVVTSVVNKSGFQTAESSPGQLSVHYEYNDRGRGPKTHTVMAPGSMTVTGVDYYKAPVNETFSGGKWSNGAESGASSNRKALYAEQRSEVGPYQSPMEDGMQHFHEFYRRHMESAILHV